MTTFLTRLTLTGLMSLAVVGSAFAGNWQTPAEAVNIAAVETAPAAAVVATPATITGQPEFFQITNDDITAAVAEELQAQGIGKGVTATMSPVSGKIFHAANHKLKVAIHALQIDTDAKLWQAQAYVLNGTQTETVKPIAGRYDATVRVPVLTRQLRQGDVIEQGDIEYRTLPERQLRKDTVTDVESILGQSPRRIISSGRPVRSSEITQPTMVKKGQMVEVHYTTPYMMIRTSGEALEDGARNALIRVKNSKTEKAITARVVAAGRVEANSDAL